VQNISYAIKFSQAQHHTTS